MKHSPVALIILDGWGHRKEKKHNAILEAKTPFFDSLWKQYPHTLLDASQEAVGLPKGTIGNSEVGHMTMGAGKVIDTELVRISKAIRNGELEKNSAIKKLFAHIKKHNSALHILGMVSKAGVHSHQEHLYGVLETAKKLGINKIIVHAFTDGRDSSPQANAKYLNELEKVLEKLGIGHIATATGRYFAMDRDKNWQRTEKAEQALFESKGKIFKNKKPSRVLKELYKEGAMDEYLEPLIFLDENGKSYPISKNDGVFFFNFRTDRPRQLSFKIMEKAKSQNLFFVTMTEYHPNIEAVVAFPPNKLETTLANEISKAGLKQSHISETEKYGHVTFFFNGGRQTPHKNEKQILIESRKDVATHDLAPEMRAKEIAEASVKNINSGDDFLVINFANADIVGHTANKKAIKIAVETIDRELKKVIDSILEKNGYAIITADHGNAEVNIDPKTGKKHTAHTTNLVPCILVTPSFPKPALSLSNARGQGLPATLCEAMQAGGVNNLKSKILNHKFSASLANIAPTILKLMKLPKPKTMTSQSLF
jgi:2,3-bisphosphoglycerate-independent phosphoglycerate mutase